MSEINTGGEAFPTSGCGLGMSLRDYFAAKVMQGIIASTTYVAYRWDWAEIAKQAYQVADAMLAERGSQ